MQTTKECDSCGLNSSIKNYIRIKNSFPVDQLLNILPGTIVRGKKSFFKSEEVYDLRIEKDSLNNWVASYMNNLGLKPLFTVNCLDLHLCIAKLVTILIEHNYLMGEVKKSKPDKIEFLP